MVLAGLMKTDVPQRWCSICTTSMASTARTPTAARGNVDRLKACSARKWKWARWAQGSMAGSNRPDFDVVLAARGIHAGTSCSSARSWNLTETSAVTLNALERSFGNQWFGKFMAMDPTAEEFDEDGKKRPAPHSVAFWARQANVNDEAAKGLYRRLKPIYDKPYIVENPGRCRGGDR